MGIKFFLVCSSLWMLVASEHLFESLLQRRAKPIRWKWSNDPSESSSKDSQRQRRFLHNEHETMVKWWKDMAPQNDTRTKDALETYFGRYSVSKRNRLVESLQAENLISNKTQSLRQEDDFQQPLTNFQSLSETPGPFEKQIDVSDAKNYLSPLSPTEKTYFNGRYITPFLEAIQNVPHQKEQEMEADGMIQAGNTHSLHDIDSELLREAIIQEQHKPSKFEIRQATQRLREPSRTNTELGNDMLKQVLPFVEYIVPSVEHVVPQVEYIDNISNVGESQVSSFIPTVEYISSNVEFAEPEINETPEELNTTEVEETPEAEDPVTDDNEIFIQEWPEDISQGKYKPKILNDGASYQIIGLRREQTRVRRNYARNLQLGLPEVDYPMLEALPVLQFFCGDYIPGYYVDITTKCQVFHICHENGQRSSFLCPVGTVFNQEYLVCDWWYNVDCENSLRYYRKDYLQTHSTINDRQKVQSRTSVQKEIRNDNIGNIESKITIVEKPRVEAQQPKLTNIPKKALNYPIGYAILLREYMKNTGVDKKDSKKQWHENFDWDDHETSTKVLYSGYILPTKKGVDKERQKSQYHPQPSINHQMYHKSSNQDKNEKIFDNHQHNHRVNTDVPSTTQYQVKNNLGIRNTAYKLIIGKEDGKLPKAFDAVSYNNSKPRDALHSSQHDNFSERERENPIFVSRNPKKNRPILPTGKPNNIKPLDINKYHFIINPKEAIVPAVKQYVEIDRHLNSNDSFIKFKKGKSIIKHINPNNRLRQSTEFSRDNLAQNFEPAYLKEPGLGFGHRYGDRISIKSRSIPENAVNLYLKQKVSLYSRLPQFFESTKEIEAENGKGGSLSLESQSHEKFRPEKEKTLYLQERKANLYSIPFTGHRKYLANTKERGTKNNTQVSLPLESQNRLKFMHHSTASDTFINNYRAEKAARVNKTKSFYSKNDNIDNEYLRDNRKITISLRIETKKELMGELNKNISTNSNVTQLTDTQTNSISSSIRPLKNLFSNMPQLNKTRYYLSQGSTDLNPTNLTKTSSTYGGYTVVKVLSDAFMTSHEGREESNIFPVYEPPVNRTVVNSKIM